MNNAFIETLFDGKNMAKSLKEQYEYSREGKSYLIANISYEELSQNELAFESFLKCSHNSINVCIVLDTIDSGLESNSLLEKVDKYFDLKSKMIVLVDELNDLTEQPDNLNEYRLKSSQLNKKFCHVDKFIRCQKLNDLEKGISTYTIVYKEKIWNLIDSLSENKPVKSFIDQNLLIESQTEPTASQ